MLRQLVLPPSGRLLLPRLLCARPLQHVRNQIRRSGLHQSLDILSNWAAPMPQHHVPQLMSDRAVTADNAGTHLDNVLPRHREPTSEHPRRQHHILDHQLPPLALHPLLRQRRYRAI